jgi:TRAP transporter 4TM/12TM fusion protein
MADVPLQQPSFDGDALSRALAIVGSVLAAAVALSALYTSGFGALPPDLHRTTALFACCAILILIKHNLVARHQISSPTMRGLAWAADLALLGIIGFGCYWFHPTFAAIENEFYDLQVLDIAIAGAAIAAVLEIGRRVWGLPLLIVTGIFLAYYLWGHLLPQSIGHFPYSAAQVVEQLWFGYSGMFSTIMGIVLNLVFVFVLFGVLLEATGAGASLLKIAVALTGRTRGGPAHAAIVASGFFGMMSGSTVANVVGTGTFTIPMMKRRGFAPHFAGGIEATASSGGQIVPPIMGAAAFVMADLIGIPYSMIAVAALVPAGLYYFNLFASVTIEARKQGIEPIPVDELPKLDRMDFLRSISFLAPIAVVIITLVSGRSASLAGFAAVLTVVGFGVFNPDLRRDPLRLVRGLVKAGQNASSVLIAIAMIGIIIATMNGTGAGLKFAGYIEYLGQGQLFLSLFLAMIGALLLGMGMPTLPAYLVIILVLGPAIERMGLSPLTIHMFVFYYGVASSITPPVALAAYAAAPIAESNPLQTGIMAVRLGAAKFVVPFIFAYNPTLLLIEVFEPVTFALVLARTVLAFFLFATVMAGFHRTALSWPETILRTFAAVLLILSWEMAQVIGLALAVAAIAYHLRKPAGATQT